MHHDVYMSPGMFGFGRLGSYNYFVHVERELRERFAAAGQELTCHVIQSLPTASIRRRATGLAETVAATAASRGSVHLLGHSTGGLDARLVASPATCSIVDASLAWLPRPRSLTSINPPHFGTPLPTLSTVGRGGRGGGERDRLGGCRRGAEPRGRRRRDARAQIDGKTRFARRDA